MRFKLTQTTVKYFVVTAVNYGAPNTTVTLYGGTDYTLINAAITNPYYSSAKAPLGFPLNPTKWTVSVTDATVRTQATPTANTWYNLNAAHTISIPIGLWRVSYQVCVGYGKTTESALAAFSTLSTANNSESDSKWTCHFYSITSSYADNTFYRQRILSLGAKTSYYLNVKTETGLGGANTTLYVNSYTSNFSPMLIEAECAYL
jgi:hypothetical protein